MLQKFLAKHKLGIVGGVLVLIAMGSLYARIGFWKSKHADAQAALVEMQVQELVYKRDLKEARVLAMTPKEIEKEIEVVYVREGTVAPLTGYIATLEQVAKCKACVDGQAESDKTVGDALGAKNKAILMRDLAITRKKKWKGVAVVGIPTALVGGFLIATLTQ